MALVVVAYLPALRAGFVWDDDDYVTENPMLRSADGLRRIWTDTAATPQYYPLTHTTFWVEYRLWGLHPAGYHAVNVGLHAMASVLLWMALRRLRVPGAWLGAALFALHPVNVESVAWVTERKNVLSGALYAASLLAYLRFAGVGAQPGTREPGNPRAYVAALVLFVGALLGKTVTATLPFTLALIVWWRRGRLGRRDAAFLAPLVVVGAALASVTAYLERFQIGTAGEDWGLSPLGHVLLASRILVFYLHKLMWPVDLTFIYPRWSITAGDPTAYLFLAAVAGVFALLWAGRKKLGRGPVVALGHFVVALAPALGLFYVYPMRYSFVADHFQYLASIGPLALAGAIVWQVGGKARHATAARGGAIAVLLCALGFATASQARIYENLEVLWRDTLSKNPEAWAAHNNLGAMLGERGELDEAARHLERAVALKPDHGGAYANLGVVHARQGRIDEAIVELGRAADLEPRDARTRVLLGQALARGGRPAEAERAFAVAVDLEPDDAHARRMLGDFLVGQMRYDEAVPHLRAALDKVPRDVTTHLNLGSCLAKLGRYDEAHFHLRRACELDPRNTAALYSLGTVLLSMNRPADAAARFEAAVTIDPGFEAARRQLERARARTARAP